MIRAIAEECATKSDFWDRISHVSGGGAAVLIVGIIAITAVIIAFMVLA